MKEWIAEEIPVLDQDGNIIGTRLIKKRELVRCMDCKWFIKKFENEGRCIKHDNGYHDPDWFCADGERS